MPAICLLARLLRPSSYITQPAAEKVAAKRRFVLPPACGFSHTDRTSVYLLFMACMALIIRVRVAVGRLKQRLSAARPLGVHVDCLSACCDRAVQTWPSTLGLPVANLPSPPIPANHRQACQLTPEEPTFPRFFLSCSSRTCVRA